MQSSKPKIDLFFVTIFGRSSLKPRKINPRLLKAYAFLLKNRFQYKLVGVGPQGWLFSEIFTEVKRLRLDEKVRFIGRVPTSDLFALYNAASLFVYPSLYEGFSLPV